MSSGPGKNAFLFLLITVLLDTIGIGIIIPVLPKLIMSLTGEGVSRAALYGGWLVFVYALMQFFCAPVLGNLSDRFGRRPVLLLSLTVFGFDMLLTGFAPTISWLFVGRLIAGMAGGTFSCANAYVADISPPEKRAQNFGMLGAAWGVGFIIGPVIGGYLGAYGPRVPFFAAAGLALLNVIYGFFVLPETLATEARRPFSWRRANPLGALLQLRQFPLLFGMLGAVFLYQIAHDVNPSIWTYYTMKKFAWTERDIGYSMGFIGINVILVYGVLIRWAMARFAERQVVYGGLVLYAIGFVGFGFASEGWMMYAWIIPFSLGGVASPAMRAMMANQLPANVQGELQGAISSLQSVAAIITPLLMTRIFWGFSSKQAPIYFPGAPFLLAALMSIGAIFVFRWSYRRAAGQSEEGGVSQEKSQA